MLLLISTAAVMACLTRLGFAEEEAGSAHLPPAPLRVYLFASATCTDCRAIREDLIPRISAAYGSSVFFEHVSTDEIGGFRLLLLYEREYGIDDDEALKLFVGSVCLSGRQAIEEGLETTVAEALARGDTTPTPEGISARAGNAPADPRSNATSGPGQTVADPIAARFRAFSPVAVALAGLVDGVNPCAFATIVFFVTLLTALRRRRRDIAAVGLCFSLSVLATYLALGVGAVRLIKVLSVSSGVSTGITVAVALLALALAGVSLGDYVRYRRTGCAGDIQLKLPRAYRVRINRLISTQMRTRNLVVGASVLGVAVSLLESLCTGQVYLPTIVFVMQDPRLAPRAFAWLLLYNVMFIAPLLGVFALAYGGLSSRALRAVSRRHVGPAKLALAAVFGTLGVLLLASLR